MYKIIKDQYYKIRGGYLRILRLNCRSCAGFISYYQKDGPGNLRRMYLDRMIGSVLPTYGRIDCDTLKHIRCPHCQKLLGTCYVYEKEQRNAIMLYQDSLAKEIIRQNTIEK